MVFQVCCSEEFNQLHSLHSIFFFLTGYDMSDTWHFSGERKHSGPGGGFYKMYSFKRAPLLLSVLSETFQVDGLPS